MVKPRWIEAGKRASRKSPPVAWPEAFWDKKGFYANIPDAASRIWMAWSGPATDGGFGLLSGGEGVGWREF